MNESLKSGIAVTESKIKAAQPRSTEDRIGSKSKIGHKNRNIDR